MGSRTSPASWRLRVCKQDSCSLPARRSRGPAGVSRSCKISNRAGAAPCKVEPRSTRSSCSQAHLTPTMTRLVRLGGRAALTRSLWAPSFNYTDADTGLRLLFARY